jgi:FAD/FMN-containing dehydrogenase
MVAELGIAGPRRRAVLAGAAAAGAAAVFGCTRGSVALAGGPSAADWAALGRDLSGPLIRPGSASYPLARRLFDPRFDTISPAGIAYCRNAHDVATCLAFARKTGIQVAARSGGHSYAGWSSTTGLIIDVTQMSYVRVAGTSATIGAGTRLIDVYNGLAASGRAIPGGSCATVGIAGLTLGGGVGVVARAYGLTSDNLLSLQIVTADGKLRECTPNSDAGLFWACRGGGGGNFGVATSFTFATHPAPDLVVFFLYWPWSQAARVISAWQSWAPYAPDQLWSNMHVAAAPGGGTPSIEVGGTFIGTPAQAYAELEKLYASSGQPSSYYLNTKSWLDAMLLEAGCSGMTVQACHLPAETAGGRLYRASEYAKSDYFTRPLSGHAIGTLLSSVESLRSVSGAAGGSGGVAFDALGGAVNRVSPGATAFVHRDALFQAQYTTGWTPGAAARGVSRQHAWLRSFWQSMRPYASGQAYQNYIDPDLPNWRQAYYGANLARLTSIKAAYDPTRLFTFPQAI